MDFQSIQQQNALVVALFFVAMIVVQLYFAHPHQLVGPHRQPMFKVGDQCYVEFTLHEKQKLASLYFLDHEGKAPAPIPHSDVTITVNHNGTVEDYKLEAAPQITDPRDTSSRFRIVDAHFVGDMLQEARHNQLTLTIGGSRYPIAS